MNILGMGPLELFLILALALVVLGPDKLPEIARQVGKTVAEIRRVSSEVTGELQRGLQLDEDRKPPTFQPPAPPPPAPPPADPANTIAPPPATPYGPPKNDDPRPPY